jgi:L-seryl-tRNA(Ser) seleniumtransferase
MTSPPGDLLRQLPAVEKLLQAAGGPADLPEELVVHVVRSEVTLMRQEAVAGTPPPAFEAAVRRVRTKLESLARTRLQSVINGTGVMIHTNLGRAPLSPAAGDRLRDIACHYNNLEFDLDTGERGRRGAFPETAMAVLTGAEAATVTNNCAAALVLILRHLAGGDRREVIISRGQLVEIGGGVRVPEIMETSGAVLKEVGTTNRVTLEDYRKAITPQTALILRVHRSNFYMEGFVGEPETAELCALGRQYALPVVEDLGSGAMVNIDDLAPVEHEPTPREVLAHGVDLVCFSGDKLFGGPQAGIICGRASLIAGIRKDPMFRALRCDKLILAALQETVLEYLRHSRGEGMARLPLLEMLACGQDQLAPRGEAIVAALGDEPGLAASVGQGMSRCGGGTMPRSSQPSTTVDIKPARGSVAELARRLRQGTPAVTGYIEDGLLRFDLRTVFPLQDGALIAALRSAAGVPPQGAGTLI